jgi:hypothetical protein
MNNRRWAIIAGLGIIELWILGLMVRSVHGSRESGYAMPDARVGFASPAAAAGGSRTERTLETGPAPHVTIDDDDAVLTVSVRPGTAVSVIEERRVRGWVRGGDQPLSIERTSDGVSIERSSGIAVAFGSIERRLDVVIPPGTDLDVQNAGTTTLSGLRADASLHSDNGSVIVSDHRGALTVKTDNGRIELHDIAGPSVDVSSDNGRVIFDGVRTDAVAIETDNARIEIARSVLRGGKIQTDNGRIRLALDPSSNVTVTAHAASGKVIAEAPLHAVRTGDDDDAPSTIQVGSGAGQLEVGSDDGSITVLAGGV